MPPDEGNPDEKVLIDTVGAKKPDVNPESEVITTQPQKMRESTEDLPQEKSVDAVDCLTCVALCCSTVEQCWIGFIACFSCCDGGCCGECVNGTCEGFVACLEGCGDCCIHCCQ